MATVRFRQASTSLHRREVGGDGERVRHVGQVCVDRGQGGGRQREKKMKRLTRPRGKQTELTSVFQRLKYREYENEEDCKTKYNYCSCYCTEARLQVIKFRHLCC